MEKNHKDKFKTPEGYFENFNERLMDKLVKEESIIPSNDGFLAPEGYLETIHEAVTKKLDSKVIALNNYRKYYFAAASIAALLVLTFILRPNNNAEVDFNDLASAEIDTYFLNMNLDLTSYDLAEAIAIEDVTLLDITETDNSIQNEAILEYLDDNIDGIEDLNLDLDYEEFN
ncbi:MAG: hypothetical protein AB8B59_17865 [Maribacter sp.]